MKFQLQMLIPRAVSDAGYRKPIREASVKNARLASIELSVDAIEAALAKKAVLIPEPENRLADSEF